MKRALFILEDLSLSGSTLTSLHVVRTLPKSVEILVLVMSTHNEVDLARLQDYKQSNVKIVYGDFPHSMSKRFKLFYFHYVKKIKIYIKKLSENKGFDWVYCHNYFISGPIFKFSKKLGCHNYFYSLSEVLKVSNLLLTELVSIKSRKQISKYCDKFIAISNTCIDKRFYVPNKVIILHDYSDLIERTKQKPFSKKGTIVLGQIGYYSENKNQLFTLKLLTVLLEKKKDARACFIGFNLDENYYKEMISFIQRNSLENHVRFYERNYDKEKFFNEIDILLMPSFSEGFPISVMEAEKQKVYVLSSLAVSNEANFVHLVRCDLADIDAWVSYLVSEDYKKGFERPAVSLKEKFILTWQSLLS